LPDYTVTFVSKGPGLDAARRFADASLPPPVRKRVSFLGGVSNDALVAVLRKAHVYVSASLSDGTSISLLEALASGLFPVLSDLPQNREWIDPGLENGILFPPGDPTALASALGRAISKPALRAGARGYNRQMTVDRADNRKSMIRLAGMLKDAFVGAGN